MAKYDQSDKDEILGNSIDGHRLSRFESARRTTAVPW